MPTRVHSASHSREKQALHQWNGKCGKPYDHNLWVEEPSMKTIANPLSGLQLASRPGLVARLPDFITLMKPRVMMLAVFTALVGLASAPRELDPLHTLFAVLATAAGAGAAGVLNMWYD